MRTPLCPRRRARWLAPLLAFTAAAAGSPAQATVIRVTTNSETALRNAFLAANALAFQTSASHPVVVEFASNLIGSTIVLTAAPPRLVVDHLTLQVQNAAAGSRVTIDATATTAALRLGCSHVAIRNLAFRNAGRGGGGVADGIIATGCDDLAFENCDIDHHTGLGLWLIGVTNAALRGCNLRQNDSAGLCCTDGCSAVLLTGSSLLANGKGVQLSSSRDVVVQQNLFDGNGEGMSALPGCFGVTFGPGNTVRNTTSAPGLTVIGGVSVAVTGNLFTTNQRSAIALLDLTSQARVENNQLQGNGRPNDESQLLLERVVGVQVRDNTLTGGGTGISVFGSQQVTVAGTASPMVVSGHDGAGLVVSQSSGIGVANLSIRGNLAAAPGAQVSVADSTGVDLVAIEVAAAPALGNRSGVSIARCTSVRFGHGSVVLDHDTEGVVVTDSADVRLGQWSAGAAGLAIRGRGPLRITGSERVAFTGSPALPSTVDGALGAMALAITVSGCTDCRLGPGVRVDGQQLVTNGVQLADCSGGVLEGLTVQGHVAAGVTLLRCDGTLVRDCAVDGAVRTAAATGVGVLVNTGCRAVQLVGNRVVRQLGGGFAVVDADDVWIGPGNRALDNAGDGFLLTDTGPTPAHRQVVVQSAAAAGRGLAAQSGFRCANVLATLCNVTATRNGTGILLQRTSRAAVVNSISYGNASDRNRDTSASGAFYSCLLDLATSLGGSWTDQGPVAGNPNFVAPASGDLRLRAPSPAIDAGRHATPSGVALPCADVDLQPRIRGGRIDLGCSESVPAGGSGNPLDVDGSWLRGAADSVLAFTLDFGAARAGQPFLLLTTTSGTGPGFAAPGGTIAPITADLFTALLQGSAQTSGSLDGSGRAAVVLALPPALVPLLPPEFTFCAVGLPAVGTSNPVVVRFLP